jgi:hypothetical protein
MMQAPCSPCMPRLRLRHGDGPCLYSSRVASFFHLWQPLAPAVQMPGLQPMPGYQQYDMPAYQQYDMPAYQAPQPILKPPMPGYQAYDQPGYQAYSPQHSAMPPQVSSLPGLACPGLAVLMPFYINGVLMPLFINGVSEASPSLSVGPPESSAVSMMGVVCCPIGSECAVAVFIRTGMLGQKSTPLTLVRHVQEQKPSPNTNTMEM